MSGILGLLIGRQLCDRYRVDSVIGTGGMGAVCRAYDLRLDRHVAVKVITAVVTDPDEAGRLRMRFNREARAAARLRHPNVVTVHDFGSDPQLSIDFLVMELLAGESLSERIRRAKGPLPVPEALEIFREAGMGLAAGHRAGLVHRDVKPGNIYLVAEPGGWEVKVLDFGIAQIGMDGADTATRLTLYGAPHTPRYASPEQLRGDAALTAASDVYSLALTALEMLGGAYPDGVNVAGDDRAAARVVKQLLASTPGLSLPVAAVIRKALRLDPAARFADAGALLVALAEAEAAAAAGVAPAAVPGAQSLLYNTPRPRPAEEGTLLADAPRPAAAPPPRQMPGPPPPVAAPAAAAPAAAPADESTAEKTAVQRAKVSFLATAMGLILLLVLVAVIAQRLGEGGAAPAPAPTPTSPEVAAEPVVRSPGGIDLARAEMLRVLARSGAREGDSVWVVVLGSFTDAEMDHAREWRDRLLDEGEPVGLANNLVYPAIRSGYATLVAGPYPSKAVCLVALSHFQERTAADAMLKHYVLRAP